MQLNPHGNWPKCTEVSRSNPQKVGKYTEIRENVGITDLPSNRPIDRFDGRVRILDSSHDSGFRGPISLSTLLIGGWIAQSA